MKRTMLLFIIALFFVFNNNNAQVRKIVLMEEATNASCGPCAANNPKLQDFFSHYFGGVISVRYHAWWPGNDPMYSLNTGENRDRINYYGITGVPNYMMDGTNHGEPSSPAAMYQQMKERLALSSPVKIVVGKSITADSIFAVVKIYAVGDMTTSNVKMRVSVIERKIEYASPPGSNGEKVFNDVMRKFLTSTAGTDINNMTAGDSLVFNFSAELNSQWNASDLAVVAWLQNDTNKNILQSGINLPTFIINSNSPAASFLELNSTYSYLYSIVNDNVDTLNIHLSFDKLEKPDDWTIQLLNNGIAADSINTAIAPNDSLTFELEIVTGNNGGSCDIRLKAANSDDAYGYGFSVSFFGLIPSGNILLVDDDGGASYETKYQDILDQLQLKYTTIPQAFITTLLGNNSSDFSTLIWSTGWGFPSVTGSDIDFIVNILNDGGNLFIAGQDIGWDIFEGDNNAKKIKDFYHNILDADYVADNSNIFSMEGITGDPISDGIQFSISNIYSRYPESIKSLSGHSVNFLKYTGSSKYGAIAHNAGVYKTVYLGIGLEQISQNDMRSLLLERILTWFGDITDVKDEGLAGALPQKYQLYQNYPNPFNPETTIAFDLPVGMNVSIKVYDSLGRLVDSIVNKTFKVGHHSVVFNAEKLSSGMYFYKMETNKFSSVKKLMLIK